MRLNSPGRFLFDVLARQLEPRQRRRASAEQRCFDALCDAVTVHTDGWGVPYVQARHLGDLFFAQGYVTARDRFFQMDYNRHVAAGRLCELVGEKEIAWDELTIQLKRKTTYDVDVLLRTFGMERSARASLEQHSSEARRVLRMYAAGVNAFLADGPRPLEHRLLGVQPRPWEESDSLLMLRGIAFELNVAWRAVLLGGMLAASGIPEDLAAAILPHWGPGGCSILEQPGWSKMARELSATTKGISELGGFAAVPGTGSNCFAVSAERSATGSALLANDTHLMMKAPSPWHEIHLQAAEIDLHGFAVAGVPGIGIGRNAEVAWGITAGEVQDLDIFIEKLNPERDHYLAPEGWCELECRKETFRVRGERPRERTIFESRHGPILPPLGSSPEDHHAYAVAWTANQPGRDVDGLLALWRSHDFESFHEALKDLVSPPYNVTYAGRDGRIGYVLAGRIPKRRKGTPTRPLEGWTGEWDWHGTVAFGDNPTLVDPSDGQLVTANNRVAPAEYPHELGVLFDGPYRFSRIHRLLAEHQAVDAERMAAIQLDCLSAWGLEARRALFEVAGGLEAMAPEPQSRERVAAELWLAWNGMAMASSAGAAIGLTTPRLVLEALVLKLADRDAAFGIAEMGSFAEQSLLDLLSMQVRLREQGVHLAETVRRSFVRAVSTCARIMGDNPSDWQWGRMHTLSCQHPFAQAGLGWLFNIGPEPSDGAPDTVNRGDLAPVAFSHRVGAAVRIIMSAASPQESRTILPGGQSGARLSRHYDDQHVDFLAGRLKPAPSRIAGEAAEGRELWLPTASPWLDVEGRSR